MKNLSLTYDEAAFLLVLLNEKETINKRMEQLKYPIDQINMDDLIGRVRKMCREFHWDKETKP
jgi:hypothetical protein